MTAHRLSPAATLFHADCRDAIKSLAADSLDSCVTDPPYALVSTLKRFANSPRSEAAMPSAGPYARASRGFMGCSWDTGETAFSTEFWAEVYRVLKPGAFVAAFGASRGYHRMACAIEDAGFEIRDSLCWLYGTGFPKSHDVSKGIDASLGAVRTEIVGEIKRWGNNVTGGRGGQLANGFAPPADGTNRIDAVLAPATPQAQEWEGFGTALKPAFEPIVLARKPLSEPTVAANVLRWRTGAINIDGCRVGTTDNLNGGRYSDNKRGDDGNTYGSGINLRSANDYVQREGRFPANVVHDGSDEVVGMFPSSSTTGKRTARSKAADVAGTNWLMSNHESTEYTDSGSAARFFYSAKASKADRNGSKHPTVKPIALMEWLATLITPPGGTILDPFAGSGTTGIAATNRGFKVVLCEREAEYVADIRRRFDQSVRETPSETLSKLRQIAAEFPCLEITARIQPDMRSAVHADIEAARAIRALQSRLAVRA